MGYIYVIINKVNNKCYVGQTRLKYASNRFARHKTDLRNNNGHNPYLQNAWNKYGKDNFTFKVLEKVKDSIIDVKEQEWIDKLCPNYNIREVCTSNFGIKWRKESVEKLKKRIMSEEAKRKISKANKGKKLSEEAKQKLSLINLGKISPNKGRRFSKEIRKRMSEGRRGMKLSKEHVENIRKGVTGKVFSSLRKRNISNGLKSSYDNEFKNKLYDLSEDNLLSICKNLNIRIFPIRVTKDKLVESIILYKRELNDANIKLKHLTRLLNSYNINLYRGDRK